MKGWLVPAYPMPDDLSDIVCSGSWSNGLSRDLATALLCDIEAEVEFLDSLEPPLPSMQRGRQFAH